MWLAARADPAAAGALRRADDAQPYPGTDADPIGDGSGFADVTASLSLSTGAVAGLAPEWSKAGGHVALQMLELRDDDLLDRLAGDWVRWTDPERPYRTVTHCDGRRGDGATANATRSMPSVLLCLGAVAAVGAGEIEGGPVGGAITTPSPTR